MGQIQIGSRVSNDMFRQHALAPGMPAPYSDTEAATAEIKTARCRIIAYLLSPIAKATQEAGREW
jgi:hypothetical protein